MAAAISGAFPVCLDQQRACAEEDEMKKKQVALMEKLRNKRTSQHRSWTDSLMKSVRTTNVDRRLQADGSERGQVQKCLDTLQRAMKVISQQSLVERLDLIARQQGLSFHISESDPPNVKLQADMFHVEIILNKGGGVKEVKIAHQGDASVCHELTDILSRGDFPDFTSHLEGLQSIYQVTAEKKLKSKAFLALQSLEKDLNSVAQFQTSISGVANYIHKSPLGILLPRTAGKPMKLIYFVSPYDLLDKNRNSAHAMTVEAITEHGLGRSVTVCLEPGPPNKLQTMPLVSFNKTSDGNCLPSFTGLSQANSALLPAHFVLVLSQPVPIAMSLIQKIQTITALDTAKEMGSQPLLSLILDSNSRGKMRKDQQLFVTLPGQNQLYFINGVNGGLLDEPGVMLSRIPFSHPTHVPKILNLLRQQLLFNSILTSCVRPLAKKDPSTNLVFEMTVVSLIQMMIVFEHPASDTIVTVDIDMSDITSLKCSLQCSNSEYSICTDEFASRVLQRCLSLPILMRSLVLRGQVQLEKVMAEAKAQAEEQAQRAREMVLYAAAQARKQQQARLPPSIPAKGRPPPPQPPPPQLTPTYPPTPSPVTSNPPSVGGMGDLRGLGGAGGGGVDLLGSSPPGYPQPLDSAIDSQDKQSTPLLVNLLDSDRSHNASPATGGGTGQGGLPITESPMLSRLLDDNISVATNITPIVGTPPPGQHPPPVKLKGPKGRKRRMQSDIAAGRSPKRLVSDSDVSERYGSIDLESSSSPLDSSLGSLGGSGGLANFHHQMGQMPARPPSQGVIDLTEESHMPHESSLKKLVEFSGMENFAAPSKDMKPGVATPDSELQALLSRQDHTSSPSTGLKPNQVTGPKNENASTSPEGILIGSGEVGKASLPDPSAVHHHHQHHQLHHQHHHQHHHHKVPTSVHTSPPTTLAAFLGHGPTAAKARRDSDSVGLHQHHHQSCGGPFPSHQDLNPITSHHLSSSNAGGAMGPSPVASSAATVMPRPKVVSSGSMTEMVDVKPALASGKKGGGPKVSASTPESNVTDKRSLFEKFDFTGQAASTAHITITSSSITPSSGGTEGEDLPKVRLKLKNFRAPHTKGHSLDNIVVQSPSSAGSKSSNSNTFDFRSDEDEDEPIPMNYHVPSERLSVYASSPTRLQISSKGKPPTPLSTPDTPPAVKPEKYKRRDKSSGNTKRKKDRDESKKERKKKRLDRELYQSTGKETLYRASTVEGDQKSTKLKIRVSKAPIQVVKTSSPVKDSSRVDMNSPKVGKFSDKINDAVKRRTSQTSPVVEKLVLQKQDIREPHHTSGEEPSRDRSSASATGRLQKSSSSGKAGMTSSNSGALSKADPKLAKALIRLKPLNITSTSSASVTLTPPVKATSGGRSISDRSERRSNQSMSTSTSVSTPSSGTLSLSSILPNAPTASSVASLPKIPKVSSSASSATTTASGSTTGTKTTVANNTIKNSTINSSFNNTVSKGLGSPGVGGGRQGSNPNTPNAIKSPGMGFNKAAGPAGMQKTSPNMSGHKTSGSASMPPGILKNSGNVSQGSTNAQKLPVPGNQGLQKGPGGPNLVSGPYNRGLIPSNQAGGPQRSTVSGGQGLTKSVSAQGVSAGKSPGVQSSVSRGSSSGNQGLQKGLGGLQKSSSVPNPGGASKLSGSPNQNIGPQKTSPQGKTVSGNPANSSHRTLSQCGSVSQKNLTQGGSSSSSGNFSSKPSGPASSNAPGSQTQGQKFSSSSGSQGRSVSNSSYNSSPNSGGRPQGAVRNNSVSSQGSGGGRTPPNNLPINRSMSAPGQKTGSSPRTPAGHSPSNPNTPRFPGNSPHQKSSGSSPSSVSQRSGSTPQTPSQRSSSSCNSTQSGSNQRTSTSNTPSQRSSSSPQTGRSAIVNPGSSPNQRPASTPGIGGDPRLSSNGPTHSPGYPVRPSSAGPRQSSSPLGPNSGMAQTSSPSGTRTASPVGQRGGNSGSGGSGMGVSPLVSRQSTSGGAVDTASVSRQNSSGSAHPPAVSRQNSSSSLNPPTVSRQNSSGSLNPPAVSRQTSASTSSRASPLASRQSSTTAVSRQNSSGNLGTPSSLSQQSSTTCSGSSTVTASRQHASGSSTSTAVSRQNLNSSVGGGSSSVTVTSATRQLSSNSSSTLVATSTSTQSAATSAAVSQASAHSGTTLTSGKPLSTGSTSTTSSIVVSVTRTSTAVTSGTQRASSSSSGVGGVGNIGGAGNKTVVAGSKSGVNKAVTSGASGTKITPSAAAGGGGGGIGGSSGALANKGASTSKANTTSSTSAGVKTSMAVTSRSLSVSTTAPSVSVSKTTASSCSSSSSSSVTTVATSVLSSSSAGVKTGPGLVSTVTTSSLPVTTPTCTSSSSSLPAHSTASSAVAACKSALAGAARGRKGSLSAIVDKLATRMSASSGPGTEGSEGIGAASVSGSVSKPAATEQSQDRQKCTTEEGGVGGEVKACVKRSASTSGLSPPSGEQKVHRLEPHGKTAISTTTTIPTPAHSTPPHASYSVSLSATERRRSGSVGEREPLREPGDVGLDLTLPKDIGKPDSTTTTTSTAPLPPPRPDSRGRASPKDPGMARSGSPVMGLEKVSGIKFNGECSSKDKSRSESEVFKVPTPKMTSGEESEERSSGGSGSGGGGGGGGSKLSGAGPTCKTSTAVTHPTPAPTSPLSPASSPENELIIDCGETPSNRSASSSKVVSAVMPPVAANPAPKRVVELASNEGATVTSTVSRASPGAIAGKSSPTPTASARNVKKSPQLSPHSKSSPSPALNDTGANSPCEIDDDLMDAALMGFNAS